MQKERNRGGRLLKCGYTTGTCAAAAAKAAVQTLLSGDPAKEIGVMLPGGETLCLRVADIRREINAATCAVRKDAGDDPDATNGMLVYATARLGKAGISIDGGEGVGRVTQIGLDQPVGAAAINSVPRQMIESAVRDVCDTFSYEGGISIVIFLPDGERLAEKTFNPRMGIEGGLSIIGTTGIVEPMSNQAVVDTVRLALRQLACGGAKGVLFTPGNYGESFVKNSLSLSLCHYVSCANHIGAAIDAAVELGFSDILLVGHIGKLVKLGIGQTDTHSSFGDGRMETLIACALESGAELPLLRAMLDCVSTDAALSLLYNNGLLEKTMRVLGKRIEGCLARRVPNGVSIGFLCFTNAKPFAGVLCQSENADRLMRIWRKA